MFNGLWREAAERACARVLAVWQAGRLFFPGDLHQQLGSWRKDAMANATSRYVRTSKADREILRH